MSLSTKEEIFYARDGGYSILYAGRSDFVWIDGMMYRVPPGRVYLVLGHHRDGLEMVMIHPGVYAFREREIPKRKITLYTL